jgi:hypothetical protein
MLTFDEPSHVYRYDGTVIPSVTQIIAPLSDYSMINPEVMKRAQELGTAVHRMTELHDRDDLEEESLDEEFHGDLLAWKRFKQDMNFMPLTIECRLFDKMRGFAGTSDRTGLIKSSLGKLRLSVIDLKKMLFLGPQIGVQLAAYQHLHTIAGSPVLDRYALGLHADGTYRLKQYEDMLDMPTFFALLTYHNYRMKHGLK